MSFFLLLIWTFGTLLNSSFLTDIVSESWVPDNIFRDSAEETFLMYTSTISIIHWGIYLGNHSIVFYNVSDSSQYDTIHSQSSSHPCTPIILSLNEYIVNTTVDHGFFCQNTVCISSTGDFIRGVTFTTSLDNTYKCTVPLPYPYDNIQNKTIISGQSLFNRVGGLTGIGFYEFPQGKYEKSSKNV